ncbi:MAG: TAXI family TRAP transporter solute-binding subunit [Desulfobacteraceae bacterium]|jgi:TRAP transporter TAXI family solute receptor|nr:MAG: TAXI family TRAP transporter solute-binding subunit [Desulfobacteraceae bacterium]
MSKRISICILSVLVFLFVAGGSWRAEAAEKIDVKWGTITAGGAWQVIGAAMLEDIKKANPNITGTCIPSTTTGNALGVHKGTFNVAFCLTDTIADAWRGEGFFKEAGKLQDLRAVATIYPQATHLIVRADSGIDTVEALRGKRISPDGRGLSCDLQTQRLFKLHNMSYEDVKVQFLSFNDAAGGFIDRHLDALTFMTVPFPFGPVINVATQVNIKLLSLSAQDIAGLTKYPGTMEYTLPKGLYKGIDYPVKGIAVHSFIIVRKDMPDEIVYSMTKTIAEKLPEYGSVLASMKYVTPKGLSIDVGIPYHPGAEKYFREKGWR